MPVRHPVWVLTYDVCPRSLLVDMRRRALTVLLGTTVAALLAAASPVAGAGALDPTGTWHTQGRLAQVHIAKCAQDLCGTIVALKDPIDPATGKPQTDTENEDPTKRTRAVMGLQVVTGMKPDGANRWSGQFYSPEDGKTVSGNLILKDANTLTVQGCIMGGLLCRSETWTRAK
jgi:uncharacterized protein (DUF2147 family)